MFETIGELKKLLGNAFKVAWLWLITTLQANLGKLIQWLQRINVQRESEIAMQSSDFL